MWDDCNELDCKDSKCVCKTVRKIADAQDAVDDQGCDVGCKQSIDDLLSPASPSSGNDTVPFILYCKGSCRPFVGNGILQGTTGNNRTFRCFESPIFRVSKIHKDCCADLELLLPVTEGGSTPGPGGHEVCNYFPGNSIRNLQRTGICVKVDLCDFVGISCLEPVRALPVSDFNANNCGSSQSPSQSHS
ncbi:CotY/CotZ family spore coat protein [Alkalibacillus almallahensis]|uniref:CotY/CotZ family spore coat protein n=1 Tax=Alkalibacillus almallahensis TaxID=1379154 RepID=UPI001423BA6B|nr:CotY/CotZ family spore coat protein [Alkalibacillus almallahensis]NIK12765.1 hypothetical protein [Alkalibacillus almallahensis]